MEEGQPVDEMLDEARRGHRLTDPVRLFKILNMRPDSADLTARAAIREAAMTLFADHGAAAVTIRRIAAHAGVSPALVIHHFGSKEGLKRAVDERALAVLVSMVSDLAGADFTSTGAAASLTEAFAERLQLDPMLPRYLRRLLVDGGPTAEMMFRRLFETTLAAMEALATAGAVRPSADPSVRAAFLLANDLAAVLLRELIQGVLDLDPLSRAGLRRWSSVVLDTYSHGIFVAGPDASAPTPAGSPAGEPR